MSEIFEIKDGELIEYHGEDRDIIIPDGVTSIGDYAFSDCPCLLSVSIGKNVKSIGNYAFSDTPWLRNHPDDFVVINGILIKYKGNGGAVTIPDSVTSIGDHVFEGCKSLTSLTIDGITINLSETGEVSESDFINRL